MNNSKGCKDNALDVTISIVINSVCGIHQKPNHNQETCDIIAIFYSTRPLKPFCNEAR